MNLSLAATPLDVCLLNGRPYVQGAQMIARACELLAPGRSRLVGAKFHRLTDRRVCAVVADHAGANLPEVVGSLQLDTLSGIRTVLLLAGREPAPARQAAVPLRLLRLQHDGHLSGGYDFEAATGLAGVLDALVQGIKCLHEQLPQPVCDVWFTGLRQVQLPLQGLPEPGRGRVQVSRLRLLSAGRQHQSLLTVQLWLDGLDRPLQGQVSFAFRDRRDADVD